jgi:two-component system response regulator HydG
MKKENILIVDDDYDMLELLYRNLKSMDFHTYRASSVTEAIGILRESEINLLITDLQMPGINGIELLKYVQEHFPKVPKLVITGYPSVNTAVEAGRAGAVDYLAKPFTTEELRTAISKVFDAAAVQRIAPPPKKVIKKFAGMIGQSEAFAQMIDIITRVKDNRATVLIEGESGTGKELVARAIHFEGVFASNPFVAVNCGALPENLLESELFGYVKGAFTGANETRTGLFQAAANGTIFLDEIGNAPLSVQTRLLRVLQEKEVSMVGSHQPVKIAIRVIAATNNDLSEMVRKGTFREDLFYRLNVVNIRTPPLRERTADIIPIAESMLLKYGIEYNRQGLRINDDVAGILQRYNWPGNIRELENVIQRMIIMSGDSLGIEDVPAYLKYTIGEGSSELQALKDVEKAHVLKVLEAVNNNKTRAAEILQIDRKTLRQKLL